MNCEILNTLYLKSNGEVLCNDDYGERILLGKISSENSWSIKHLFENSQYQEIRRSFQSGTVPWPGVCEHCAFLRTSEPYADLLLKRKITKFQLEPSLACNLECPCCTNFLQMRNRSKPFLMPTEQFGRIVSSLAEENFSVETIEYCGQGEPLMHPQFRDFVSLSYHFLPSTKQRLITNGNFRYSEKLSGQYIDEIYVSCDGVRQASYEQYRVKGDVSKPLQFLADVPREVNGKKQLLVWKYILFEFNDSDDEILEAQRLAQEFGVDILLFVMTHSRFRSSRFTLETIGNLPVKFANVRTNAHPSFYNGAVPGHRVQAKSLFTRFRSRHYHAHVEELFWFPGNVLFVRGWAGGREGVDKVIVRCNGQTLGEAIPLEERPDVLAAFPKYQMGGAGFRVSSVLPTERPDSLSIELSLESQGREIGVVREQYTWV